MPECRVALRTHLTLVFPAGTLTFPSHNPDPV
jgi:hypothetical protein